MTSVLTPDQMRRERPVLCGGDRFARRQTGTDARLTMNATLAADSGSKAIDEGYAVGPRIYAIRRTPDRILGAR